MRTDTPLGASAGVGGDGGGGVSANATWYALTTATSAVWDYGKHTVALPVYEQTVFLATGPYCFWTHLAVSAVLVWLLVHHFARPRGIRLPLGFVGEPQYQRKKRPRGRRAASAGPPLRKRVRFRPQDVPLPELPGQNHAYVASDDSSSEDDRDFLVPPTGLPASDSDDDDDDLGVELVPPPATRGWCGCCRRLRRPYMSGHAKEL